MVDTTADVAIPPQRALPEIAKLIRKLDLEVASVEASGGSDSALIIMENILAAETEEELFRIQSQGTTSGKDYTGRAFRLAELDIEWKRSRTSYVEQGAFPYYALLHVTDMETGNRVVLDCGGKTFVTVLAKLQELDGFTRFDEEGGRPLMLQSHPTGNGDFAWLSLHPVVTAPPASARGKKS